MSFRLSFPFRLFHQSTTTSTICSVTPGGELEALAAGSCVVLADQAGNDAWRPAPQISQSLTVSEEPNTAPTISGTPATTVVVGELYQFTPTASDADEDDDVDPFVSRPITCI